MKTCYQLHTTGESINGWRFKMKSKAIFLSKSDAELFVTTFTELCCDKSKFEHAIRGTLEVKIIEHCLYEEGEIPNY